MTTTKAIAYLAFYLILIVFAVWVWVFAPCHTIKDWKYLTPPSRCLS